MTDQEERDERLTIMIRGAVEDDEMRRIKEEREAEELLRDKSFLSVPVLSAIMIFSLLVVAVFLSYQPVM